MSESESAYQAYAKLDSWLSERKSQIQANTRSAKLIETKSNLLSKRKSQIADNINASSSKKKKAKLSLEKSNVQKEHIILIQSDEEESNDEMTDNSSEKLVLKQTKDIDEIPISNSIDDGKKMLGWLLATIPVDNFLHNHWEKKPLLIKRNCPSYYNWLLSTESIDKMLREQRVEFTKNLDITSYRNGIRETHNPDGRAMAPVVWDFYRDGCSLRMLNPQTFIQPIHKCNAILQEYFQCMTGANFYLTPPNSQGFAPHYDDIEAFILQIEGKKSWKLYKPRSAGEYLPRVSSKNFNESEIGEPILETTLEAGDCLYFPRGTIHQATTIPDNHSLHITLSVYQKQSYADLFETMLPLTLTNVINENISFRQGLPLDIWQNMGIVHQQNDDNEMKVQQRKMITDKIKKLFLTMVNHLQFDEAIDRMAIRYQHDALPPILTKSEKSRTVYGTASKVDMSDGQIDVNEMTADTEVRLIRANILRLVRYDDSSDLRVYFHADNSREYHEYDENYLQIDLNGKVIVEKLIKTYPEYVRVGDLEDIVPKNNVKEDDEDDDDDDDEELIDGHIQVIQCLWDRGLLMTKNI